MLKKWLSRIGIGAAAIDLILPQDEYKMGETAKGTLIVNGGEVEQEIGDISVDLRVKSRYKSGDDMHTITQTIRRVNVTEAFRIQPGEQKEFDIAVAIPEYIPVSSLHTRYYFLTNLGIEQALDSKDVDPVTITPSGLLHHFLEAFHSLGFIIKGEAYNGRYQIMDFRPTKWLAGQIDELVFGFQPANTQHQVSGFFEVDKKSGGLMGFISDELDLDERKGRFTFRAEELESVEQAQQTIRSFIEKQWRSL